MLYAILCYNSEDAIGSWSKPYHDQIMERLAVVQDKLSRQGRLGPVARLLPTTAATTLRKGRENMVIDGPFAETKEPSSARPSTRPSKPPRNSPRPIPAPAATRSGRSPR
jgi:hypothetical protein